ncbi:hypothetical protein M9X92_010679 [Pyricularia oryzae]|nr:hypothetical protein M9X92_010679 [Pyricularia oryzae]
MTNEVVIPMGPIRCKAPPDAIPRDFGSITEQTRTRRLFEEKHLLALNITMYGSWYVVGSNIYFAMLNGGPMGWLFSYIIVAAGVLCQAASFAEISSIKPVAGAQYYWTYEFAPPPLKLFLTWIQGWTTWLGYVSMLASTFNTATLLLQGIINIAYPEWIPTGWQTTLMILASITLVTLVNLWAFRAVPWFELLAGILNILLFLTVLILLWVVAPRNSVDVFLVESFAGGWGKFPSFNIGTLSNIYLFVAFESTVHLGEETRNPKHAVPASMFWGFVANAIMGFIMLITYGIVMPSVEEILSSVSPLATIVRHGTGSDTASTVILSGILFGSFAGIIGIHSSVSRLTWAWARDGGLSRYFALVDSKTRVPMRAVLCTTAIIVALSLLNLNNKAYIALGAVTSLSTLSLYSSYTIALSCIIYFRLATPGGLQLSEWNCGRYGLFFNIFALVYTVYEIVWLPFPSILPVTAANMNYAGPVYLVVVLGAVGYWFLWARKNWSGPNMEVVEIVLNNELSKQ